MNIWIFNHYAIPPTSTGGTRHYDIAVQLKKFGKNTTIFASSFNHFTRQEMKVYHSQNYVEEKIDGVHFCWIKTVGYQSSVKRIINMIQYSFRAYKAALEKLKQEKPHIVIGSSVHPLAAFVGYLIAKKARCPFYFEERDLWPQTLVDFGKVSKHHPVAKLLYQLEKFLYNKATRIILLFEFAINYVSSRGISKEKVLYLPNGYNEGYFSNCEISGELKKIMEKLQGKKIVIYTGSHGIANHLDPLIKLAQLMQDEQQDQFHFVFVGDGPEKKKLIDYVEQNKLLNVTFLEPIPKKYIPFLLQNASFAMISMKKSPLYKWGFSMNKLYDYLAAGLPIIMYSDLEEIGKIDQSKAIMKSDQIEKLRDMLVDNKNIFDSEKIQKFAFENYSWSHLSKSLNDKINEDVTQL